MQDSSTNFHFFRNVSPYCFFHSVEQLSSPIDNYNRTAHIIIKYTFNNTLHEKKLTLKDKRKLYSNNKLYEKAYDQAKKHLLGDKDFMMDEFSKAGGFLSKQLWEDNIRFSDLNPSLERVIDQISQQIAIKAPYYDKTQEIIAEVKHSSREENKEWNNQRIELQNQPQYALEFDYNNQQGSEFTRDRTYNEFKMRYEQTLMNQRPLFKVTGSDKIKSSVKKVSDNTNVMPHEQQSISKKQPPPKNSDATCNARTKLKQSNSTQVKTKVISKQGKTLRVVKKNK